MNLITLFEKMRDYQAEQLMKDCDKPIPDSVRLLKDEDIDRYYFFFYLCCLYITYQHMPCCAKNCQFTLAGQG
jgi:hypothetical protein